MSYSHKDKEFALSVKQQLTAAGFDVWLDTSKLEAGYQWKTHILEAIRTCSAMVVIATPNSAASHWVMREISYAVEFDKLIIPLLAPQDEPLPIFGSRQCACTVDEVILGLQHLPRVFICHAPEDNDFVERLQRELGALGAIFWHGSPAAFQDNLKTANISMLLIISPESVKSPTVQSYYQIFTQAGYRRAITPVLVRHSTVSPELRGMSYIDFLNQNFEIAFKQLYGRLVAQRVKLNPCETLPIPPQPPLLLDGIGMFRTAEREIWISGLIMDTFAPYYREMIEVLRQKPELRVRILLLKLDVQLMNETGEWVGINQPLADKLDPVLYPGYQAWVDRQSEPLTPAGHWIALRLYKNQQDLKQLQAAMPDRVEIYTSCQRPGMGYFIVDKDSSDGMLVASPYFYQIDAVRAKSAVKYNTVPIFLSKSLSIVSELWWFNQYVQEFERLWADAQVWEPE